MSGAAAGSAATVSALPTPPPHTSCTSVVHIGDSTSEGLISADYEPNPANRIPARYADVGIKHSIMKIVGADLGGRVPAAARRTRPTWPSR